MSASRRFGVAVSAAALLAAAACGGGGNGTASKSAKQIVKDARQAATKADTVHVAGTIKQGSKKVSLDLHEKAGTGAKGTITLGGSKVHLIRTSKAIFIKGSPDFYTKQGAPSQLAKVVGGKWFKVPGGAGGFGNFESFTDPKTLFSNVLKPQGSLKKVGTSTRHGIDVVGVKDTGDGGGTLYVRTSGTAYPVEVAKGNQGSIRFTDWNGKVSISAPKNAVNPAQLRGALNSGSSG
jgi:hypothetical protein